MSLHLVKLCVGVDSPERLEALWRGRSGPCFITTRQTPKRAAEILEGGSLYWVFKGSILGRQAVEGIGPDADAAACRILLRRELVRVAPAPRRPFQGWRYLEADEAPPDLGGHGAEAVPTDLARRLREIGAW